MGFFFPSFPRYVLVALPVFLNRRMETMVRLDMPLRVTLTKDGRRLPRPCSAVRACAGQAVGLAEAAPLCAQAGSCPGHSLLFLLLTRWLLCERWLSAGASHSPRQRCPRAVSLSPQPRGMDRAASGSLAGFVRPGRGLHSAPHFPRTARAGTVCRSKSKAQRKSYLGQREKVSVGIT